MAFKHLSALASAVLPTVFVSDTDKTISAPIQTVRNYRMFNCTPITAAILGFAVIACFSAPAVAKNACYDAIQEKIAYDYQGNTAWSPINIDTLCEGVETTQEPATCFDLAMHGGVLNRDRSPTWNWQEASRLCSRTSSYERTILCFVQKRFDENFSRADAIAYCNAASFEARSQASLSGKIFDPTGSLSGSRTPPKQTLTLKQDGVYLANWEVTVQLSDGTLPYVALEESSLVKGYKSKTIEFPEDAKVYIKATMVGISTPVIVDQEVGRYGSSCIILKGSVFGQNWDENKSC